MLVRSCGERLPTVLDHLGVPAQYPTYLILEQRAKHLASTTLLTLARDLVHLGQWVIRENIDVHQRLEDGHYLSLAELSTYAEAAGLTTAYLRQQNGEMPTSKVIRHRTAQRHVVTNMTKSRRITTGLAYFNLIGRIGEAQISGRAQKTRIDARLHMSKLLEQHRPRIRSSRVRSQFSEAELSLVLQFILHGDPAEIWPKPDIRTRNWAMINLMVATGARQAEIRQLKVEDIDFRKATVDILRRPDDPEDPRPVEPNAKTLDRTIPIPNRVAELLEAYVHGPGSDAAMKTGSSFVFLTQGPRSIGSPIGPKVVARAVHDLGAHLGIPDLHPHALRKAWIQKLTRWAIENKIPDGQLDRIANYVGGWSHLSKSASEYRGDQLTRLAYEAGMKVEGRRNG